MIRTVRQPLLPMVALIACVLGSVACAAPSEGMVVQAPTYRAALTPEGVRSEAHLSAARSSAQDLPLPERDALVQMPGKVTATELPEYRNGEGARLFGPACGIVPEDRDRR